jgi:hypothetical protein
MKDSPPLLPVSQDPTQVTHDLGFPRKKFLKSAIRSLSTSSSGGISTATPTPRPQHTRQPRKASLLRRTEYPGPSKPSLLSAMTPQGENRGDDEKSSLGSYENFNTEGISQEELLYWSKLAPEGQKLEDVSSSPIKRPKVWSVHKRMLRTLRIIQPLILTRCSG